MEKRLLLAALFVLGTAPGATAQVRLVLDEACSYYGETIEDEVYGFASDREAEEAVKRVVDHTGLPQNFRILAANVPNAAAEIDEDGERMILYNQTFMKRVTETAQTDWAAVSILAHEIGHHLSGHTLKKGGSRPEIELQADSFSGYVLYKMGAGLDQAQAAMEAFADERRSETHPPRSARLAAIANGWTKARDQNRGPQDDPSRPPPDDEADASPGEPPPDDEGVGGTVPLGNAYVTQCAFVDGSGLAIDRNGQLVSFWNGLTLVVGMRRPSTYPNVQYELFFDSNDVYVAGLLVTLGVYQLTYYVDAAGRIWRTDVWGNFFQNGTCQPLQP